MSGLPAKRASRKLQTIDTPASPMDTIFCMHCSAQPHVVLPKKRLTVSFSASASFSCHVRILRGPPRFPLQHPLLCLCVQLICCCCCCVCNFKTHFKSLHMGFLTLGVNVWFKILWRANTCVHIIGCCVHRRVQMTTVRACVSSSCHLDSPVKTQTSDWSFTMWHVPSHIPSGWHENSNHTFSSLLKIRTLANQKKTWVKKVLRATKISAKRWAVRKKAIMSCFLAAIPHRRMRPTVCLFVVCVCFHYVFFSFYVRSHFH